MIKTARISSAVPYMLKTSDNPDGTEEAVFEDMASRMRDNRVAFFFEFFKDFFGIGLLSYPVSSEVVDWARRQAMLRVRTGKVFGWASPPA